MRRLRVMRAAEIAALKFAMSLLEDRNHRLQQNHATGELHRHRPRLNMQIPLPPAPATEEIQLSEDDNDFAEQQEQVLVASSRANAFSKLSALLS